MRPHCDELYAAILSSTYINFDKWVFLFYWREEVGIKSRHENSLVFSAIQINEKLLNYDNNLYLHFVRKNLNNLEWVIII